MSLSIAKRQDTTECLRGIIRRVTFRNPENGYSVLQVTPEGSSEPLTLVGWAPEIHEGSHIEAQGSYVNHPKFGKQFSAASIHETLPENPSAIEEYLSSGIVSGIGERTAEKIVAIFGDQTFRQLVEDHEKVAKDAGVPAAKTLLLKNHLIESQASRDSIKTLIHAGLSLKQAQKIFQQYGERTQKILESDPYRLAREVRGIGFNLADRLALSLGLKKNSPQRIKAGII